MARRPDNNVEPVLRLTRGRDFRLIWTASIVSQLGDWAARLALALLVLSRGEGATTVGIIGALFVMPWLGPGQILTAWSARFGRRIVLITCDSLRGTAFIAIGVFDLPTPTLLAIVAASALADPVFEATKSAFVTEIVPKDDYADAIQITHAGNQASSLAGYALGGILVAFLGAASTLTINGLSFLLSSALIVAVSQPGVHGSTKNSAPSISAGYNFLRNDRISAIGFAATVAAVTTAMAVESQVAVYGSRVASMSEATIGFLSAATPAATLVAVTVLKTSGDDATLLKRGLKSAGVASAAASLLLFLGSDGVLLFVAFLLVGVIFNFVTMTNVVVGRRLPTDNRVSIFSILQTGVFLGFSLGSLAGGLVSEATSPEVAAGGALAIGTMCLAVAGRFLHHATD